MKNISFIFVLAITLSACTTSDKNKPDHTRQTPAKKEKFKWDFNSGKIYTYSFEQVTNSINDWSAIAEYIDTSNVFGNGTLKVKSKGNNKADFVLKDLRIENDFLDTLKSNHSDKRLPAQTMVLQDMDANGNFEAKKINADIMFDLIFPLPSYDFKIGEKEQLKLEIPFNLMGSPLYVKGFNELEYLKDIKKGQSNYAMIKSTFVVDQLDIPAEIKGEFTCSFTGTAVYEFDDQNHHFISANIDLEVIMKSKYDTGKDGMGMMNMRMENRSKYQVKFVGTEE